MPARSGFDWKAQSDGEHQLGTQHFHGHTSSSPISQHQKPLASANRIRWVFILNFLLQDHKISLLYSKL